MFGTTAFNVLPDDGTVWFKRCRKLVLLKYYCESDDSCLHWLVTVTKSDRILSKVSRLAEKQTDDGLGR